MTERTQSREQVVHVQIGRLTLDGYTQPQQQRFLQALDASLLRLCADRNAWSSLTSRDLERLDPIQPPAGGTVEDAARLLARQLFRRLDTGSKETTHV